VTSELDAERRERLTELVRAGGQTVLSTTEPEHVPGARDADVALMAVCAGRLSAADEVAA
jgi:DNA replication and repair protein RecF